MFVVRRSTFALPLMCGLAIGCSGGGGAGSSSFAELDAEGTQLAEEVSALDYTARATLPVSGTASYDGIIQLRDRPDAMAVLGEPLIGDLAMQVDFGASDPVSGSATDFVTATDEEFEGRLEISNSNLDRGSGPAQFYTYLTDFGGTLTNSNDEAYEFDGRLGGDFRGTDHSHAAGVVSGALMGPDSPGFFQGEFVAEQ